MKRKKNGATWRRCSHWLSGMLCCAWLVAPAEASTVSLRSDAPERYIVAKGDTLWDISDQFLDSPWQWPEVWEVNPQIRNPHLIYPGDAVYLYYDNGQPRLGLERGEGGVVRLSPEIRQIPRRTAVPPLPLETVKNFLEANRIVVPELIDSVPYVVAGDDRRILSGGGDRVYVRGQLPSGQRFGLYRPGVRYRSFKTGEFLGLEMETLGEARFLRQEGDIALLEVVSSRQEIRDGDLVLPLESVPVTPEFQPHAPIAGNEGRILDVPGGVRFIGRLDVVALDLGHRDGLEPGHVLAVEQLGETVNDPVTQELLHLPGEDAGWLMVFRVYDRVSYALVMHATRSLAVGDRVHSPQNNNMLVSSGAP